MLKRSTLMRVAVLACVAAVAPLAADVNGWNGSLRSGMGRYC
jgi:hypothetical protein